MKPTPESRDGLAAASDRGWALCLSGGGFSATLFHLGVLIRLNELGVLARLSTITSVSGGSILNGVLASRWSGLTLGNDWSYTNLIERVAGPIREFCSKDLRTSVLFGTRLNPANWGVLRRDWFSVSANFLADGYEPLYGSRLSDVPPPGPGIPRFVFCATNVRTGACWHFHGGPEARMGDFYAGYCDARDVRISEAVAASSAFTPGFSRLPAEAARRVRVLARRPRGATGASCLPSGAVPPKVPRARPSCSPMVGSTITSPSSQSGRRTGPCSSRTLASRSRPCPEVASR